jgi:hypothetical protein
MLGVLFYLTLAFIIGLSLLPIIDIARYYVRKYWKEDN